MRLCMIWAQNRDGIIGDGLRMPWHLPEDLQHFKATTMGAPVIMGRATWESLGPKFRPLPGRRNVVLSRSSTDFDGAEHAENLDAALAAVADEETVWIIGGGHVYREALARAEECVVTEIDTAVETDSPVYAPQLTGWRCVDEGAWQTAANGLRYRITRWAPAG
ncbi:dihydrofolate reductase [Corynebacterium sp. TAE3-ERU12]|uniref:dihydrofolate reductase n=1 Tax=Corynebacterium sp. TAE3-ERU12 TaxID=2849491 RepID=UPI00351CCB15